MDTKQEKPHIHKKIKHWTDASALDTALELQPLTYGSSELSPSYSSQLSPIFYSEFSPICPKEERLSGIVMQSYSSTVMRVHKVTMLLIMQFSWPADVIRLGLTCKWCQELSLRPELWDEIFNMGDLSLRFVLSEIKNYKSELFVHSQVLNMQDRLLAMDDVKRQNISKNCYVKIMYDVFRHFDPAVQAATRLSIVKEQLEISHWCSYVLFLLYFVVLSVCLLGFFKEINTREEILPPSAFEYAVCIGVLPCIHRVVVMFCCCPTIKTKPNRKQEQKQVFVVAFLADVWYVVIYLSVRCQPPAVCSYYAALLCQLAIVLSGMCWILRLYYANNHRLTVDLKRGCIFMIVVASLFLSQIILVSLKLSNRTRNKWVLWSPTWAALVLALLFLMPLTCKSLWKTPIFWIRIWILYFLFAAYFVLLVLKFDFDLKYTRLPAWTLLLAAELSELVASLSFCPQHRRRYKELEQELQENRDATVRAGNVMVGYTSK